MPSKTAQEAIRYIAKNVPGVPWYAKKGIEFSDKYGKSLPDPTVMPRRRRYRPRKRKTSRYRAVVKRAKGMLKRRGGARFRSPALPGIGRMRQPVTFKVCGQMELVSGTTEKTAIKEVSPSNVLDPFGGNGIAQPLGWDQWVNFYQKYRCTDVWCKVTVWKELDATSVNTDLAVGVLPSSASGDIGVSTQYSNWCFWPRVKKRLLIGQDDGAGRTQKCVFKFKMNPASFFSENIGSGNYDCLTSGTNATNVPILAVFCSNSNGDDLANAQTYAQVHMEFHIHGFFFDRKELPGSAA